MNNKYLLIGSFFLILIAIIILLILSKPQNQPSASDFSANISVNQSSSSLILYTSTGCPYCKIVEDYLVKNNLAAKLSFVKKNVDADSGAELMIRAQACNLTREQVGVPLLWNGEKCLIGAPDIIEFFENEIEKIRIKNIADEAKKNASTTEAIQP